MKDIRNKKPLSFCNITIKGTNKGGISNEEGVFRILVDSAFDSLIFSYLGYQQLTLSVKVIQKNREISLTPKDVLLNEIIVFDNNTFLYEVMEKCRKKIKQSNSYHTKVYFQLQTEIANKPVEMLECYYNGHIRNSSVEKLFLKGGRVGLALTQDNSYFVSLNTSKTILDLKLTEQSNYLPYVPFQYGKNRLKKNYELNLLSNDGEENLLHIGFKPHRDSGWYFKGDVWVNKETFQLIKINLSVENTSIHPFLPLKECDSLWNVSMYITQNYDRLNLLNHINFSYQLQYLDSNCKTLSHTSIPEREINTSCFMFFYDYEQPFILPYFNYDHNLTDYRKISIIPYNRTFWEKQNGIILTEGQQQSIDFFRKNGLLINYNQKENFNDLLGGNIFWRTDHKNFFKDNNIEWSESKRLRLKDDDLRETSSALKTVIPSDNYNLKAQIFLDINSTGDSIQHFSVTLLDVFQTYFDLPKEPFTDCFFNIYFDICEIERRNMEKKIATFQYNIEQMDTIYHNTVKSFEEKTKLFFKEVQSGKNKRELLKWNNYVLENLGIDNAKILGFEKNE